MSPFKLTAADTNAYTFSDVNGTVTNAAGANVGTWSTDVKNNITINKPDGTTLTTVQVQWSFNATNQLCLADSGGNAVANFGPDGPEYSLVKNVLVVLPGDSLTWTFQLYCTWGLDANNNLTATFAAGGNASTITGYVQNSTTQFVFWFVDPSLSVQQMLAFNGAWGQIDKTNNPLKLSFQGKVDNGTASGLPFNFALNNTKTQVNPVTNNLELTYSDANGIYKTVLQGSLAISGTSGITFSISDQLDTDGSVAVNRVDISIGGTFELQGGDSLTFHLDVVDVTGATNSLQIGGDFQAQIGSAGLQIAFTYQSGACPTCGTGTIANTTIVAVSGGFTYDNVSGKFMFSYTDTAGGGWSIDVTGQMQFGKWDGKGGLQVKNDPIAGRSVTAFLGVSW